MPEPRLHNRVLILAMMAWLLGAAACCGASGGTGGDRSGAALSRQADRSGAAPSRHKAGTEPGHYDGSGVSAASSGEKDFLASLESAEKPDAQAEEPPVYVTLARFGLTLALVLGLAYVTILGLKRFTGLKTPFGTGQGQMRVVENLSLGAGRVLHLVEIGSRRLVVASTASSVTVVTEIAADELLDASSGSPTEPPTGFKDHLTTFLGGKTSQDQAEGNVARLLRDSTDFVHGKIARLGSIRRRLRDA